MANKCNICGKFASTTDVAKCVKCSQLYHRQCVNIGDGRVPNKWQCNACKSKNQSASAVVAKTSTPSSSSSRGTDTEDALTDNDARGRYISNDMADDIKFIREQLINIANDMAAFRTEIAQLNTCLNELNTRVEDIDHRVILLEQGKPNEPVSPDIRQMEEKLLELQCQLNDRDQEAFQNDIQISGVTEQKGENPLQIVTLLAKKIGVDLSECDVVSVSRVGIQRENEDNTNESKPRPLIVRLGRRAVRDQLIKAARVRRAVDTAGLNIDNEPRRFYVNERLTRLNSQLFYKAKMEGRRHDWRYVWTRDGRVYARRTSDSKRHRIRTEFDIPKVFGEEHV